MTKSGLCFTLLLATTVTFGQAPPGGQHGWGGGPRMAGPGGGMGGSGMMGPIMGGPGSRVPVTGAPFSGVETTQIQQKLSDGNVISRQETTTIYRDSQGRVRMEHPATPPGSQTAQTRITIFDPVGGFSYVLNPADKTARKMTLPPAPASGTGTRPRGPRTGTDPAATKTEDLGTKSINNVPATGIRVTTTIPAGAIGNQQPLSIMRETWIGSTLKIPVQMTSSDPRFGSTTMNLGNITQAEPNLNLFVVPADYTVTTVNGMGPGGGGGGGRAPNHRQPQQN